ncbi:MAG: hypothetical protein ACOCSP_00075 [archaeon]
MAFENMTALELHLHLGDTFDEKATEETSSIDPLSRPKQTAETTDDEQSRSRKPLIIFLAGLVLSITLSILVTLVVKRFTSDDEDSID